MRYKNAFWRVIVVPMRVLNLSLDKEVLKEGTLVQKRLATLAAAAGEIVVLTPFSHSGSKVAKFFKLWKQARKVLSEKLFDFITVQDTSYLALLAYMLAKKSRIPLEVQVHGFEKLRGVRKLLARFVLRHADKIRVVSERLRREISPRSYVLPVYTQIPSQPPLCKGGEEGGDFVFLTVGRLVPVKNIALQIRAFAQVVRKFPQARLVIVGDGPEQKNLGRKAKSEKVEEKIRFEGRQENLEKYYQEADAFLLTSDSEGWGVVVTEAAAYGLPIIMTDVGCAGEFIKNGENGIVIPVSDEDALVAAMRRVIEDTELRARLGHAARASFAALPSADEQIRKQVEEWRLLVRQRMTPDVCRLSTSGVLMI
ncbi:MAG: glycosyltransferase [Parcubacteria group bacterium Gr01-1014_17]|nr:MAG: glycosyltransferase [Parcubacteria group bacterium Gr01-1014_17]